MIDFDVLKKNINQNNEIFFDSLDRFKQKSIGQFTTPEHLADFMARRLIKNFKLEHKKNIKILDPGAGSGVLGISVVEELFKLNRNFNLTLVVYENDLVALDVLRTNLEILLNWSVKSELSFKYEIKNDDYVLEKTNFFEQRIVENKYDLIISNPPYRKLNKKSEEAELMPYIVYGSPNEYGFFLAKSILELKKDGACIYITPRSWLSGAYFEKLRTFLFKHVSIVEIHSFNDRNNIFGSTKVLQELIVFVLKKQKVNRIYYGNYKNISTINKKALLRVDTCKAILGKEKRILTISSFRDLKILEIAQQLKSTFANSGVRMRTGLTVTYRNKERLRSRYTELNKARLVPIFYSSNFYNYTIMLKNQEFQYIETDKNGLLQRNSDYIFVKRFSTKEQKRRIHIAYYDSDKFKNYSKISTDNKINFISSDNRKVLKGTFLMLGSTFFDKYYRLLGSNTQVNSSEINSMKFPTEHELIELGNNITLDDLQEITQKDIDSVVNDFLKI